jgi:hypothetical protein
MSFCDNCGAKVEWHKTAAGANMPIDPDPHPQGDYGFVKVRLVRAKPGTHRKMYRSHLDTCPKKRVAPARRAPFVCDLDGCEVQQPHRHCFKCKSVYHLAEECDADEEATNG